MLRSHDAGSLRATDAGLAVTLAGWVARRRDHGGVAFIDLRDASGVVQVVIHDEAVAHPLRSEFCLRIVGTVRRRPEGNDNPNLATGEVEVEATVVEVLSESAVLPFPIEEHLSRQIDGFGEGTFDIIEARIGASVGHCLILQRALTALVAHRAVQRVVDQQ